MNTKQFLTMLLTAGLVAGTTSQAAARTKLVTLPDRAKMIVNLEHPDYSLLVEEREIALQQGANHIDFSWQGVAIDKNSIRLEILSHPGDGDDATKMISVAFPPNEAALTWQLYSPAARAERIRVSYLLQGIGRSSHYEMTVNPEETESEFRQYFQVANGSGEDFDAAVLRTRQGEDWERSIETGETRRFLAIQNAALPLKKIYSCSPAPFSDRGEDGEVISMVYEVKNDEASGLGEVKLDSGKTRVFSADPDGSTIFLGEDFLAETAVGEDVEIRLGTVKDIVLKRRIMSDKRENERRNRDDHVVLYDRVVHVRYEIENFKDKVSTVRVVEALPRDAELVEIDQEGVTSKREHSTKLEIMVDLDPRPEEEGAEVPVRELNFTYQIRDIIN